MNAAVAMQNAVWLAIWPIKLLSLYEIPSFTGSVENRGEGPGRP